MNVYLVIISIFYMFATHIHVVLHLRGQSQYIFPLGPVPYTLVALTDLSAYLNVRQRKLGTIVIQTVQVSISYRMIVRTQGDCPREIIAWATQHVQIY